MASCDAIRRVCGHQVQTKGALCKAKFCVCGNRAVHRGLPRDVMMRASRFLGDEEATCENKEKEGNKEGRWERKVERGPICFSAQ